MTIILSLESIFNVPSRKVLEGRFKRKIYMTLKVRMLEGIMRHGYMQKATQTEVNRNTIELMPMDIMGQNIKDFLMFEYAL